MSTELLKCLKLAGNYEVYGCDISPASYDMYDAGFERIFLVDRKHDIDSSPTVCRQAERIATDIGCRGFNVQGMYVF